jgi:hypothetical protein
MIMIRQHPRLMYVLGFIHACYFLIAGIWPLIDIESFMAVTGPKTDIWLVKTVGMLVSICGILLLSATLRNRLIMEIILLAIFSAAALSIVDIYYAWTEVISEIYLLDAAAEIFLIMCWFLLLLTKPGKKRRAAVIVKEEEIINN